MFKTHFPFYGFFIFSSIVIGLFFIYKNSKSYQLTNEERKCFIFFLGLGAIFGAKYFSLFINFKKYSLVSFFKWGLSSYGAIIGMMLMLFLFTKLFKKSFKKLIFIIFPFLPLMYAIGKVGCFLAGCCYGREYNGLFHVTYFYSPSAPAGVNLFPAQLLESIIFSMIFIYIQTSNKKHKEQFVGAMIFLCSLTKFLLDYLRMSHIGKILSINQMISLFFMGISLFIITRKNRVFITES